MREMHTYTHTNIQSHEIFKKKKIGGFGGEKHNFIRMNEQTNKTRKKMGEGKLRIKEEQKKNC